MLLYEGIQICSERKTEANMATSSERSANGPPCPPPVAGPGPAKKAAIPAASFPGILPASGLMSPHGHSLSGMFCQHRGDPFIIFPQ